MVFPSPSIFECSDNNEADTVVSYFTEAYAFLLRVYSDRGRENVKVASHNPIEIQLGDAVFTINE